MGKVKNAFHDEICERAAQEDGMGDDRKTVTEGPAYEAALAQIDEHFGKDGLAPPFKLFTHEGQVFIEIAGEQYSLGMEDEAGPIMADFLASIDFDE